MLSQGLKRKVIYLRYRERTDQWLSNIHRFTSTHKRNSAGAAEGVRDWSDHLRKISTTQLLVRPKFCKYKTLTAIGKVFGPTKVGVVGPLPSALFRTSRYEKMAQVKRQEKYPFILQMFTGLKLYATCFDFG